MRTFLLALLFGFGVPRLTADANVIAVSETSFCNIRLNMFDSQKACRKFAEKRPV